MAAKSKRKNQHIADVETLKDLHPGGCLNAHHGAYTDGNTCSYRWQARVKALSDASLYTWPRSYGIQPPKAGAWDLAAANSNFKEKSTVPYWHESHHIIPHAELNNGIAAIGKGKTMAAEITRMVRSGLMEASYKLNDKVNMIILPMLSLHARATGLPKHRATPQTWHHAEYSALVKRELERVFLAVKEQMDPQKHNQEIDFGAIAEELEDLSASLYRGIKAAGQLIREGKVGDALKDLKAEHLLK